MKIYKVYTVTRARIEFEDVTVSVESPEDAVGSAVYSGAYSMRVTDPDGNVVWQSEGLTILPPTHPGVIK